MRDSPEGRAGETAQEGQPEWAGRSKLLMARKAQVCSHEIMSEVQTRAPNQM